MDRDDDGANKKRPKLIETAVMHTYDDAYYATPMEVDAAAESAGESELPFIRSVLVHASDVHGTRPAAVVGLAPSVLAKSAEWQRRASIMRFGDDLAALVLSYSLEPTRPCLIRMCQTYCYFCQFGQRRFSEAGRSCECKFEDVVARQFKRNIERLWPTGMVATLTTYVGQPFYKSARVSFKFERLFFKNGSISNATAFKAIKPLLDYLNVPAGRRCVNLVRYTTDFVLALHIPDKSRLYCLKKAIERILKPHDFLDFYYGKLRETNPSLRGYLFVSPMYLERILKSQIQYPRDQFVVNTTLKQALHLLSRAQPRQVTFLGPDGRLRTVERIVLEVISVSSAEATISHVQSPINFGMFIMPMVRQLFQSNSQL